MRGPFRPLLSYTVAESQRMTAAATSPQSRWYIVNAFRGRCLAMVDDARLLRRDWGFRLVDVKVPLRWWHGETDHVVPVDGVHTAVARLQDGVLTVRPESHLGGFAMTEEVLAHMRASL
jgi:pimeloyl-ACP methyl ester carboxylesterase